MDADKFVVLCEKLLALGATDISAGVFRASFPRPMLPQRPREREEPHGPPKPRDPALARHEHYRRVMGETE